MSQINFKEDFHKIKFSCCGCGHCCRDSKIRLSPYDILRICKRLNISTKEFHQKYSYFILDPENQNLLTCMLKTNPECSFLSSDGCKIYEDRSFGCRVFPLTIQHFFLKEGTSENKTYILEECRGFRSNKKKIIEEFKEEQGVKGLMEIQERWVEFKVKSINTKIGNKEEYDKLFFNICYDFDGEFFKQILKDKGITESKDINEKYELIMKLANELLL